jgi:hypothetical protein
MWKSSCFWRLYRKWWCDVFRNNKKSLVLRQEETWNYKMEAVSNLLCGSSTLTCILADDTIMHRQHVDFASWNEFSKDDEITINKTLSLENFRIHGPHQGFIYMLLTFKLLKLFRKTRCFVMWHINVIFIKFIKFTTYETVLI